MPTPTFAGWPVAAGLVADSADDAFAADHGVVAAAVAAGDGWCRGGWATSPAAAARWLGFAWMKVAADRPGDVAIGLVCGAAVVVVGFLRYRPALVELGTALTWARLRPPLAAGSPAPSVVPAHVRVCAGEVLAGGGVG